ncbi:MAG: hypothetical protein ABR600_04390 [Actinomycetota bacterium]
MTLYEDVSYGGASRILLGDVETLGSIGWDDRASSIKLSPGCIVRLYADPAYSGTESIFTSNQPDFTSIGWNDIASSIQMGVAGSTAAICAQAVFQPLCQRVVATYGSMGIASDAIALIDDVMVSVPADAKFPFDPLDEAGAGSEGVGVTDQGGGSHYQNAPLLNNGSNMRGGNSGFSADAGARQIGDPWICSKGTTSTGFFYGSSTMYRPTNPPSGSLWYRAWGQQITGTPSGHEIHALTQGVALPHVPNTLVQWDPGSYEQTGAPRTYTIGVNVYGLGLSTSRTDYPDFAGGSPTNSQGTRYSTGWYSFDGITLSRDGFGATAWGIPKTLPRVTFQLTCGMVIDA